MAQNSGARTNIEKKSSREINQAIKDLLKRSTRIRISGLSGQDNIAVGLKGNVEIDINGDAGRYLGAFNDGPVIVLDGNCGDLAADNQSRGGVIVRGDSGKNCGIFMLGGILVIRGNSSTGLGKCNNGGTIIIDGDVSGDIGEDMKAGTIIVTGHLGGSIGKKATGGILYTTEEPKKNQDDSLKMSDLSQSDISKLKRYFEHYRIDASPVGFRKYSFGKGGG